MSLTAFFKENVVDPYEETEFVVSDRFKDEEGNPIKWKLRPLNPDGSLNATEDSVDIIQDKAKFKTNTYYKKIVVGSIVYPNLRDQELQDNYGVMTPEDLLNKMLNAAEFNRLLEECQKINGLNKSFDDKKEEVKN